MLGLFGHQRGRSHAGLSIRFQRNQPIQSYGFIPAKIGARNAAAAQGLMGHSGVVQAGLRDFIGDICRQYVTRPAFDVFRIGEQAAERFPDFQPMSLVLRMGHFDPGNQDEKRSNHQADGHIGRADDRQIAGGDLLQLVRRHGRPLGRIGRPEDMAGVSIYLASQAGAYVTGAVIPVDGGMYTTK